MLVSHFCFYYISVYSGFLKIQLCIVTDFLWLFWCVSFRNGRYFHDDSRMVDTWESYKFLRCFNGLLVSSVCPKEKVKWIYFYWPVLVKDISNRWWLCVNCELCLCHCGCCAYIRTEYLRRLGIILSSLGKFLFNITSNFQRDSSKSNFLKFFQSPLKVQLCTDWQIIRPIKRGENNIRNKTVMVVSLWI